MPRPGLVVGLGGTGQWVLTWLKRDLELSNQGNMPENVRLLEIDTATRLEAGAARVSASGQKEEAAVVGGVRLSDDEFIYVGGDSRPYAELVKSGHYRQIRQWYQSEKWLSTQTPATFILDDGAGRLRQFGRMAVFKDILGQETNSVLWRAFRAALEGVRSATNEQRRLEIMVVGSFAGGTGSGMFIDISLILRMLAQQMGIHHVLRGYFALPSVFTTAPDSEMRARSFAAWRELNRFMVVAPDFPMPEIEYVEDQPTFRISPDQRLFDACYLVDGKRAGKPIADEAKYGVFPMMAESISAILDEEAGTAYTQWITTNLANEYARRPETPMYSAVGAYTVQVPAHYVQQVSSHVFAQDVLLKLLSPRIKPDEDGRLLARGADRLLALAAPDKNLEDRGFAGRTRARSLYDKDVDFENKTAKPSNFTRRIAQLVEIASDQGKRANLVNQLASAGGADPKSNAVTAAWTTYFPDLGSDPTFEAIRRDVSGYMSYNVLAQYGRREGQKEEDVRNNFKKIPADLRDRFGGVTSTMEEVEEYYGKCGDSLKSVERVQLIMFRQVVNLRLLEILNGRSDDPIIARSGKLGYAWDYFDGAAQELNYFLTLMHDVKRRREEIKPQLKIAGLEAQSRKLMESNAGKKLFWFFESPQVKGSENSFLLATQRGVDLRREDILHFFVVETARAMLEIVTQVRDQIQDWVWHLSTGDDTRDIPGLWNGVLKSMKDVRNAHSYDSSTPKVQKLVAEEAITMNEADLAQVLAHWKWNAVYRGDNPPSLELMAEILPEAAGDETLVLKEPSGEETSANRYLAGVQNQSDLLGLVNRRFSGLVVRTFVADQIKREFKSPETFAREVAEVSAEPLFDGAPGNNPRKKSNLIRVKTDSNDPYFIGEKGLEGILRGTHKLDRAIRDDTYGIQVVQSENPYKLTLVRTDDLYQFDHFAAWSACLQAYASHMDVKGLPLDPVLMQNFAAEGRAVDFERRLMKRKGRTYKPLHPRVVMLLENQNALRQFAYLGMLGLLDTEETRRTFRWVLHWELDGDPIDIWLTRGWNADEDAAQRVKPDIMHALHGYVIGGASKEPDRNIEIDYDEVQRFIDLRMEEIGAKGQAKMLDDNLKGGFIMSLKKLAYKRPQDEDLSKENILRQDMADLAAVFELILKDEQELAQSRVPKTSGPSAPKSTSSMFATYTPEPAPKKPAAKKTTATTKQTTSPAKTSSTAKKPASSAKTTTTASKTGTAAKKPAATTKKPKPAEE